MSVTVIVPTALKALTDSHSEVPAEGSTIGEVVGFLATTYPDLRQHLFDEAGELRTYVNFYLNDVNIKSLGGLDTPVFDNDTVVLVPAIAGGLAEPLVAAIAGGLAEPLVPAIVDEVGEPSRVGKTAELQ